MMLWVDWALLGVPLVPVVLARAEVTWRLRQDCSLPWLLAGCSTGALGWNAPVLSRWPLEEAWPSPSMVAEFQEGALHVGEAETRVS